MRFNAFDSYCRFLFGKSPSVIVYLMKLLKMPYCVIEFDLSISCAFEMKVPVGSPSRGGDVVVYVKDISQPSLPKPTPFYSVLVSISIFMALSTAFSSINSPENSPLSHSVLPILILPCWFCQLYISVWKSPSALLQSFVADWAQSTN